MPDTVLVPFDGSPLAERALEHAVETFPGAAVTAIYVIDPTDSILAVEADGLSVADSWYDDERERATGILATATDLAAEYGADIETVTATGQPVREIVEYAEDNDLDQIVLGSHSRNRVERALLGSVAETVVRRARIPVTVVA